MAEPVVELTREEALEALQAEEEAHRVESIRLRQFANAGKAQSACSSSSF
jgi:hypothetical protein